MKKIILSLVAIATLALNSLGQAPEGFKYQAVVRDAANLVLNNQSVGIRLTIQQGSIGGTAIYTETFTPTTNAFGLVNLEIGTGTTTNDFALIDWANGPYFIETAVDITGGTSYSVMGTSQLMSVPYALHAKTAESAIIDLVDDADADSTNELNSGIALNGTALEITDAGSTLSQDLDGTFATDAELTALNINDADADPTNEHNTGIALNGTTIEVTDAGGTLSQDLDGTFATDAELTALNINDADADPTNEHNTGIALNGTAIEVTDAGGTLSQDLDGTFATDAELTALNINDADADPTNEIQDISLSNSDLTISNGSTVDLSGIDTDTQLDEAAVDAFVSNNGYLTSVPSTERSILITPGMVASNGFYSGAAVGTIGGWGQPCLDFQDGVNSMAIVTVPTPSDWDGAPMLAKILYTSDGTTGDFQLSLSAKGVKVGQSLDQGVGGGGITLPVPTGVNILSEASFTSSFGNQTTDEDIINIWIRRQGSSANDTSTDVLRVVGVVLYYNTL